MEWLHTLSGLGVGLLVGLTGVGGGALMTPLLIVLFGIAPSTAVGTDLLFASITKTAGIWMHARRGTVAWDIAGLLAAGSLPAAFLAILALERFGPAGHQFETLVKATMGLALMLTALALLFKERLQRLGAQRGAAIPERRLALATVATGVVLGLMVTLTSIGAGALGAAALFFLYPRLPTARIVGTDLAHAVPLAAVAGLGHLHLGTVNLQLLASLLMGSLPGIYLGSHLGAHIPERILRRVLALMLAVVGGKLVW